MSARTPAMSARVGDIVQTYRGELYRVEKIKQVNYGVVDEDGKRWNLRKTSAFEVPEGVVFSGPEAQSPVVSSAFTASSDRLYPGTVIEFIEGKFMGPQYVVIRENFSSGTVSAAKLGGDGGRYVRGISTTRVRKVEL